MDQELIAYFDERFREMSQQIQGLRDQVKQVAEGRVAFDEKFKEFQQTVTLEFSNSRFQVNILFKDLNHRVRDLELRAGEAPL